MENLLIFKDYEAFIDWILDYDRELIHLLWFNTYIGPDILLLDFQ